MKSALTNAVGEVSELKSKLDATVADRDKVRLELDLNLRAVEPTRAALVEATTSIHARDAVIADLKDQLAEVRIRYESDTKDAVSYKNRIYQLQQELASAIQSERNKEENLQFVMSEVNSLKTAFEAEKDELIHRIRIEHRSELDHMQRNLADAIATLRELEQELMKRETETFTLKSSLETSLIKESDLSQRNKQLQNIVSQLVGG
jgi:chromosome segregation ATPase